MSTIKVLKFLLIDSNLHNDDITEKLFLILNVIKNKEGVKMNYFFYEVEHFYKDGGPSGSTQCNFPKK